jgi:hypothetical protein
MSICFSFLQFHEEFSQRILNILWLTKRKCLCPYLVEKNVYLIQFYVSNKNVHIESSVNRGYNLFWFPGIILGSTQCLWEEYVLLRPQRENNTALGPRIQKSKWILHYYILNKLKIVEHTPSLPNEKNIKIKRPWLRLWCPSEIHRPFLYRIQCQ